MNLSAITLAKIYVSRRISWFGLTGVPPNRLSKSEIGGVVYVHSSKGGRGITILGINNKKGEVPVGQIDDAGKRESILFIVLPGDMISPSLLAALSEAENLVEGFRIEVMFAVGKDSKTGELKYDCCGFDGVEDLANTIKKELTETGTETDFDPYSVPALKMKAAIRKHLAKKKTPESTTIREANQKLKNFL